MQHPLPDGTKVRSMHGEIDHDEHDILRETPAGLIGTIQSSAFYEGQGWTYLVVFPNGAWVFVDQSPEGIDDPKHYQVVFEPSF